MAKATRSVVYGCEGSHKYSANKTSHLVGVKFFSGDNLLWKKE